jgi:hypothetical protein
MDNGRRGCLTRLSMTTKASKRTALATSDPIVAVAVQDWVSALEKP